MFQATHVSSWEALRLALSAAMQRAPLRRAAQDKMSSLHAFGGVAMASALQLAEHKVKGGAALAST